MTNARATAMAAKLVFFTMAVVITPATQACKEPSGTRCGNERAGGLLGLLAGGLPPPKAPRQLMLPVEQDAGKPMGEAHRWSKLTRNG